jgi:hypothetical protein
LLDLVSRLQFLPAPPDLEGLRGKAIEELQRFERQAAESGAPPDRARVAHYVLCATIDDIILAAPWGAYSVCRRRLSHSSHQAFKEAWQFINSHDNNFVKKCAADAPAPVAPPSAAPPPAAPKKKKK